MSTLAKRTAALAEVAARIDERKCESKFRQSDDDEIYIGLICSVVAMNALQKGCDSLLNNCSETLTPVERIAVKAVANYSDPDEGENESVEPSEMLKIAVQCELLNFLKLYFDQAVSTSKKDQRYYANCVSCFKKFYWTDDAMTNDELKNVLKLVFLCKVFSDQLIALCSPKSEDDVLFSRGCFFEVDWNGETMIPFNEKIKSVENLKKRGLKRMIDADYEDSLYTHEFTDVAVVIPAVLRSPCWMSCVVYYFVSTLTELLWYPVSNDEEKQMTMLHYKIGECRDLLIDMFCSGNIPLPMDRWISNSKYVIRICRDVLCENTNWADSSKRTEFEEHLVMLVGSFRFN